MYIKYNFIINEFLSVNFAIYGNIIKINVITDTEKATSKMTSLFLREWHSTCNKFLPNVIIISTHTPTQGATKFEKARISQAQNSYSRPCVRGDISSLPMIISAFYFYSRPCVRDDGHFITPLLLSAISTHAPA